MAKSTDPLRVAAVRLHGLAGPLDAFCRDSGLTQSQVTRLALRRFLADMLRIEPLPPILSEDAFLDTLRRGEKPPSNLADLTMALTSAYGIAELSEEDRLALLAYKDDAHELSSSAS